MRCSTELSSSIKAWASKREEAIQSLRNLADELMQHHKNVHIAKVSGSSTSIAGFGLVATGFGLAPVSFGTSLILSAVGGAVCAGGGMTAAGASIAGSRIFKSKLEEAQQIIDADRCAQEPVKKLMDKVNDLNSQASKITKVDVKNFVSFKVSLASFIKNLVDVGKVAKSSARVATTAVSEGAEAVVRSIGVASNAARIGLFAVSAAFLPLDIYTMVTSAMEIDSARKGNRESEPEVIKMLRKLAEELEQEMNDMLQAVYWFENSF